MAAFATTRLVLFAKARLDGTFSVALRVTYRRKSRFFFLNRHCSPEQWDKKAGRFERTYPDHRRENDRLLSYERRASDAIREMERDGIAFSFERFEQSVFSDQQAAGSMSLSEYVSRIVQELDRQGSVGNAAVYHNAGLALTAFRPKAALSDLDTAWIARFEKWMRTERSVTSGGLSVALRTLRAVCNRAISEKLMPRSWYPFADYSLSHLKARKAKKSAGLDFIRALEAFEPSEYSERLARDLFLFSFYCRGINLADMAELTPDNIVGERLIYRRKKTGAEYSVKVSARAAEIVERYASKGRLFPIYTEDHKTEKSKFWRRKRVAKETNRTLRQIAEQLGLDVHGLSFYTARHTYADSLKKAGVSVEVISQALGHADVRTTDSYLRSFGDDVIDAADRLLE